MPAVCAHQRTSADNASLLASGGTSLCIVLEEDEIHILFVVLLL